MASRTLTDFLSELRRYLRLALTYLLLAWFAYNGYQTIRWIAAYYVPLPTADYWRVSNSLSDYQNMHVAVLWRQHNEHRIVFPEIVFALDMLAAHGRFILPIVLSGVCYFLTWAFLAFTVITDNEISLSHRVNAVLLAGVVACWEGSAIVLAQPFLLQWPTMQLSAALSLVCLKKTADTANRTYLAGTIAAAVVATYSSGNALVLWPLLLAIASFIHLPRRFMAALSISAALFIGLYFVGYHFSPETNLRAMLLHPGYAAGFLGSYLSMPFGAYKPAGAFGVTIGLINLALFGALVALARRFGVSRALPVIVLGGFYLFTLLTIFITMSGRLDITDPNFTAAKVPRYLTVPLLNWAALVLLGLWMSARLRWRTAATLSLTVASSLLLLFGLYKLKPWRQATSQEFAVYQFAAMSLDLGLVDSQLDTRLFPMPELVAGNVRILKLNHLAVFFRSYEMWLGRNVQDFRGVKDASISGEIVYTYPVEHGVEVVGWVDPVDTRDPLPRILLANENGKIVGFGRQPPAGFPADLRTFRTPEKQSWVGFVNLRIPSRAISAYLVTRTGLLPINGVMALPALESAAKDEVGPPISAIAWRNDAAWTQEEAPSKPRFGWQPSASTLYSWSGHDSNTGQASAEFLAPANACVVLPIVHGPSIGGASAQLTDADSERVLAELPFREHDPLWTLWRVPLSSSVKRLRFVAIDNGRKWGQWLAVSTPLQCK